MLTARRDVDGNGTAEDYFFHADDLYSVTVVTDATGAVVERYEYGAFGQPTIYAPDLTVRQTSVIGNTLMFNGRPYDAETGFYYYRTRYLDPRTGRFTTRDTIGIWGDPANLGNGYAYVGNNPWTMVDPYGLNWISVEAAEGLARTPSYVFWSGGDVSFKQAAFGAARAWAAQNGGVLITATDYGQAIRMATSNLSSYEEALPYVQKYAAEFSRSASGVARLFTTPNGPALDSVWTTTELPALVENPDVTKIISHTVDAEGKILSECVLYRATSQIFSTSFGDLLFALTDFSGAIQAGLEAIMVNPNNPEGWR